MSTIYIIAHNIRSAHNIGSLFRTSEGLGIDKIIISGYTPYPQADPDERLPHIAVKVDARIAKTALGSQKYVDWERVADIAEHIKQLKSQGFTVLALEQSTDSIQLPDINQKLKINDDSKLAIILGSEVTGIDKQLMESADYIIEIPMYGHKESYNVIEAATMMMYQLRLGK